MRVTAHRPPGRREAVGEACSGAPGSLASRLHCRHCPGIPPTDAPRMSRRVAIAAVAGVILLAAWSVRTARHGIDAGAPAMIPTEYCDGAPSLWLFVRTGCPHCERHLEALDRSLAALDPARRGAALARLRIVGSPTAAPGAAVRLPVPASGCLRVRVHPTTWMVNAAGSVGTRWLGPRDAEAWEHALAHLAALEDP